MNIKVFAKGKFDGWMPIEDGDFNLDWWNGSNWCFGNVPWEHRGIKKFHNHFVLIFGDDTQGRRTYAEVISSKKAKKLINVYKPELLEEDEFKELQE